jgi:hypothetical protein
MLTDIALLVWMGHDEDCGIRLLGIFDGVRILYRGCQIIRHADAFIYHSSGG